MTQSYRYGPSQWKTWCAVCDRVVQAGEMVHFGGGGVKLHVACHEIEKSNEALKGLHWHEFPATWDGKCLACPKPILKGQALHWSSATICCDCRPAPRPFGAA
jgi:hypothetical protein